MITILRFFIWLLAFPLTCFLIVADGVVGILARLFNCPVDIWRLTKIDAKELE